MRRWSVPAGSLLGIRLRLHVTWFLVLAVVVGLVVAEFGSAFPDLPRGERIVMGLVTGVSFFGCLLCHEVAHAVVARRFGIRVRGITLFLLGGVAEIEGEPPTPSREFAMALAGPATSVALGSACGLAALGADTAGWRGLAIVLATLASVNLGVAVFNLVPGLPLDGGRLLRAVLWRLTGSYLRATRAAAGMGAIVAIALGVVGAALAVTGTVTGLWYMVMATFIFLLARRAGRAGVPSLAAAAAPGAGALAWGTHEGPAPQPRP